MATGTEDEEAGASEASEAICKAAAAVVISAGGVSAMAAEGGTTVAEAKRIEWEKKTRADV